MNISRVNEVEREEGVEISVIILEGTVVMISESEDGALGEKMGILEKAESELRALLDFGDFFGVHAIERKLFYFRVTKISNKHE